MPLNLQSLISNSKSLPVILGPTGVGKTKIAVEIASELGAEIISCDSRQIYQDMDIGTSKPSIEELKKITHWFINIISPDVNLNAWDYALLARKKIKEIWKRKKIPIVVGGSGLYLRALIDGFFRVPSSDGSIRENLECLGTSQGVSSLYEKLKEVDSVTARSIHPRDHMRIIRALEVYEMSGMPISVMKKQRVPFDCIPIYIGLTMSRELLYKKIEERVDKMMDNGFLLEVKELFCKYISAKTYKSISLLQTIGYKELIAHIQGEINLEEAIELIKQNTRRYAKRQFTWFKSIENVHWIELPDNMVVEKCKKLISKHKK